MAAKENSLEALLKRFAKSTELEHPLDGSWSSPTNEAYDEYLGFKLYHSDPLPLEESVSNNFVDSEFPTHESQSLRGQTISPGILTERNCLDFDSNERQGRIKHFLSHAEKSWGWKRGVCNKTLFASENSVHPRNVVQGKVGNCGFCAGIASIAAVSPGLLRSMFGTYSAESLQSCGAYSVRIFPKGRERYLLLDDSVLCTRNQCCSPSLNSLDDELWLRLLEKVFCKLQGSLASLDGYYKFKSLYRHPARALQLITGAPLAMEMHYRSDNISVVYDALINTESFARVVHCRKDVEGLLSHHGYSLLWVGEAIGCVRLVCLRNPHGRHSYKGTFGFGSKSWQDSQGSLVKADLLQRECFDQCPSTGRLTWRKPTDGPIDENDDGIFFMDFHTFVECFPVATIVGPVTFPRRVHNVAVPDCVYKLGPGKLQHANKILKAATEAAVAK